jgi:prepilin-type N-terminal cleavage/methylation domain-containing protein
MRRRSQRGMTLLEVLIAVSLFALLSAGMLFAIRAGFSAFTKTNERLMTIRRAVGAQRLLEQELQGLMTTVGGCGKDGATLRVAAFRGDQASLHFVSAFSLNQGWRGRPQTLDLFVVPGEDGEGVRLVVNETPYTGTTGAAQLCLKLSVEPATSAALPVYASPVAGPDSFVLADKLAYCRFFYQTHDTLPDKVPAWVTHFPHIGWPHAIRIEMAPLAPDPGAVQPITVTVPLMVIRNPEVLYDDK